MTRRRSTAQIWADAIVYPTQSPALLTIGVLTAARIVGYLPGIVGWFLDLLVWVAMYRYVADVLWQSANGRDDAPEGHNASESVGWTVLCSQLALLILALGAFWLIGPRAGVAALVVLALAQPGAAMSAAIDEDWVRAIDPRTWLGALLRLGVPYLLLSAACLCFAIAQAFAPLVLARFLPGLVAHLLYYLVVHYLLVAGFRAMGSTIHAHRERLGFEPRAEIVRVAPRLDPDQVLLDEAEAQLRRGQPQLAIATLRAAMDERGVSAGVHARYRALLAEAGDQVALLAHSRRLIDIGLAQERARDALAALREARGIDPDFVPQHGEAFAPLVRAARDSGDATLALALAQSFAQAHPRHRDAPELALLESQLLARAGRDAEARSALERTLASTAPQHPRRAELEAALSRLRGATA